MKRILIVDDDRQAGDVLQEILAAQGWVAETAQTPEQALRRFDRETFDLVISDINLEATQTGLDLLKAFRRQLCAADADEDMTAGFLADKFWPAGFLAGSVSVASVPSVFLTSP